MARSQFAKLTTPFAILTAFLGIYLGFDEPIKCMVMNILARFVP
ncbi:hypothetical protein [Ralstonia pseudosolanacearum]|nr:hypothetical protein [Ralstonia pseudosolanacearum]